MRRHWRLEPGLRHGDSRCGQAEEALPSGRSPPGAQVPRMGRSRSAARAFGCSSGRLSSGCRLGPRARATSGGGRDLAGVRRGLAGCNPHELRAGRPGIRVRLHPYAEMRRASPCGRHPAAALRSRVSEIEKCQRAAQRCAPTHS